MAIIYSYPPAIGISPNDILLGVSTVGGVDGLTRSFPIGELASAMSLMTPTLTGLNQILAIGNASQLDAKVGDLYLWDTSSNAYGRIDLTSSAYTFYDSAPSQIAKLSKDGARFYPNNFNGFLTVPNSITANRTYTYPDSSGIVVVTPSGIAGTVTSVGMTVPTGLTISGSPIVSAGTLALGLNPLNSIPLITSQTNWDTAYANRITSLTTTGIVGPATLVSNVLNIPNYSTPAGTTTVIVKQLSDFPSPIANVITLAASTQYLIVGFVNIGNNRIQVSAGPSAIFGFNRNVDRITSTTTGDLFTIINQTFIMHDIGVTCSNANVFNINITSPALNVAVFQSLFISALTMGTVGTAISIFIFRFNAIGGGITSAMSTGGFTFTGTGNLNLDILYNYCQNNNGIAFNLNSSIWENIAIIGNKFEANAGQTIISGLANSGNLSGATSVGLITNNIFFGAGAYTTNILTTNLKWNISTNSANVRDSETIGEMFMTNNAIATANVINVPIKAAGVTSSGELARFDMPLDNRLRYIGLNPINLLVSCAFSMTKPGGGAVVVTGVLYVNGSPAVKTTGRVAIVGAASLASCVSQGFLLLQPNDYIELWLTNLTDSDDITVVTSNFIIG